MIRTQRLLALGALALLLMAPTSSIANPGGNGDSSRDYTCGGSCHGDPGLSQPSDGTISIGTDTTAFSGTVTAVHVSASGMSLSGKRILGVFLLSSLNGNDDLPSDYGWSVIQDPNGGISNYVETVVPESGSATLTWVLRTPSETGTLSLYAAMHHGSESNQGELAFLGVSQAVSIDILPVPENYPQLADDWTAPDNRITGDDSPLIVSTNNTDQVSVLWRLEGEWDSHSADVENVGEGEWEVKLPATMAQTRIEYQITTHNGGFTASQPWLTIGTIPPEFDGTILGARLQAFAFATIVFGFLLSLQTRLAPRDEDTLDPTSEVEARTPVQEPAKNNLESRLVAFPEHPGWLWDPVEEQWVPDTNKPPQGGEL